MLTIVMPTKNHAQYLKNAINNIFSYPSLPVNLLVCDDASTDETNYILSEFCDDSRIRAFRHNFSLGAIETSMELFELVKTPYVMFMASDDYFYPDRIFELLRLMISKNSSLGFGKYSILENDNLLDIKHPGWIVRSQIDADDFQALLACDHYIFGGVTIYKKSDLPRYTTREIPFNLDLNKILHADGLGELRAHDWNLALDMALLWPNKICFYDQYCGVFRIVSNQLSSHDKYHGTGRAAAEMALLIKYKLSNSENVNKISLAISPMIRDLFINKVNATTNENKKTKVYREIYLPIMREAAAIIDSLPT